jgi:hypothetical protein
MCLYGENARSKYQHNSVSAHSTNCTLSSQVSKPLNHHERAVPLHSAGGGRIVRVVSPSCGTTSLGRAQRPPRLPRKPVRRDPWRDGLHEVYLCGAVQCSAVRQRLV